MYNWRLVIGFPPKEGANLAARQEWGKNAATYANNLSVTFVGIGLLAPALRWADPNNIVPLEWINIKSTLNYIFNTDAGIGTIICFTLAILFRLRAVGLILHMPDKDPPVIQPKTATPVKVPN